MRVRTHHEPGLERHAFHHEPRRARLPQVVEAQVRESVFFVRIYLEAESSEGVPMSAFPQAEEWAAEFAESTSFSFLPDQVKDGASAVCAEFLRRAREGLEADLR